MSLFALSSCIYWKPSKFNLGHSPASTALLNKDAAGLTKKNETKKSKLHEIRKRINLNLNGKFAE